SSATRRNDCPPPDTASFVPWLRTIPLRTGRAIAVWTSSFSTSDGPRLSLWRSPSTEPRPSSAPLPDVRAEFLPHSKPDPLVPLEGPAVLLRDRQADGSEAHPAQLCQSSADEQASDAACLMAGIDGDLRDHGGLGRDARGDQESTWEASIVECDER